MPYMCISYTHTHIVYTHIHTYINSTIKPKNGQAPVAHTSNLGGS
jgi:hypothetical protein